MSNEVFVKLTSDERSLLDGLRKWQDSQKGVETAIKSTISSSKQLGLEQKKALDSIATPLDKYNAKLAMAKRLLDANKLSTEQYQAVVSKAKDSLDKANQNQANLTSTVIAWSASLFTVSRAMQLVNSGMEYQNQLRKEAVSIGSEASRTATPLAQLASTPQQYAALKSAGRNLFLSGYGESQGVANQAIQAIQNNNMLGDLPTLTKVASEGLESDLAGLVDSIALFKNNMDGAANATKLIGQGLIAGEPAQGSLRDVYRGAATASASAKMLGLTSEELLAATGVAMASGGKDVGPTNLSALLQKLSLHDEYVGKPLVETIQSIKSQGLAPKQLQDLLGDASAIKSFSALSTNLDMLSQQVARTKTAETEPVLEQRLGFLRGDATAQADLQLRRSLARRAVGSSGEERVQAEMLWEAFRNEAEGGMRSEGKDWRAWGYRSLADAGTSLHGSQTMMRQAADPFFAGRYVSADLYRQMISLLEKQNQISQEQAEIMQKTFDQVRQNRPPLPTQQAPAE